MEIVMVDDVPEDLELFSDTLKKLTHDSEIHSFPLADKVLEFTKSRMDQNLPLPELYVVDIHMPEMDGFELIDEINELVEEINRKPSFIVLSGSNHARDFEKFNRLDNAIEYIVKTTDPSDIRLKMNQLLFSNPLAQPART